MMIDGINQSPAPTYIFQGFLGLSGLQTGSIHVDRVLEIKSKQFFVDIEPPLNHH